MTSYKITNLIQSSVVIEDIGVFLPCKGSSVILNESVVSSSKDLKSHKNWLKVEPYNMKPKKSVNIWPFTKSNHKVDRPNLVPQQFSQQVPQQLQIVQPIKHDAQDIKDMRQMMHEIVKHVQRITDQVTKLSSVQVPVQQIQYQNVMSSVSQDVIGPNEPMFIPSQILPKKAEVRINSVKDEVKQDSGVEEAMAALRKLRKM